MVKCQAVNLPPWKIARWFPRVINILKDVAKKLQEVEDGGFPDRTLLPTLSEHWEELNEEHNDSGCDEENTVGTFQGMFIYRLLHNDRISKT